MGSKRVSGLREGSATQARTACNIPQRFLLICLVNRNCQNARLSRLTIQASLLGSAGNLKCVRFRGLLRHALALRELAV